MEKYVLLTKDHLPSKKYGPEPIIGRTTIESGYVGIKTTLGNIKKVYNPGVVYGVPFIHEIYRIPTTIGLIALPTYIITKDHIGIETLPHLSFRITDPVQFLEHSPQDYLSFLRNLLLSEAGMLASRDYFYPQLRETTQDISDKVTQELEKNKHIRSGGLEIVNVTFPEIIHYEMTCAQINEDGEERMKVAIYYNTKVNEDVRKLMEATLEECSKKKKKFQEMVSNKIFNQALAVRERLAEKGIDQKEAQKLVDLMLKNMYNVSFFE